MTIVANGKPEAARGIACPECGGKTRIWYTRSIVTRLRERLVGGIRRCRICTACGHRFLTKETPQG